MVWEFGGMKEEVGQGVKEEGWTSEQRWALGPGTFHLHRNSQDLSTGKVSGHSGNKVNAFTTTGKPPEQIDMWSQDLEIRTGDRDRACQALSNLKTDRPPVNFTEQGDPSK